MKLLRTALLATTGLSALIAIPSIANPLDANVIAGDASVSGTGTAGVVIDQTSGKAIINWRTFDIGTGETTTFRQPDANSVTLNRVTGGLGASQILGTLKANGQVFLINPDGILIGKDATIDVGALVATTHDMFDGDFLKGNYEFGLSGNPSASVVNLGKITVSDGGFAALVAPGVRNAGTITARLGKVALGSGQSFSLDPYGDDLIKLGVSDDTASEVIDLSTGKPLGTLVGNDGNILADGGLVQLSASATRKIIDAVVNNTGVIEADTVGTRNGKIVLSAATSGTKPADAPTQTVKISGTLSASGKNSGETGGDIEITGEQIALAEATIDAFGWSGGGQVLVGGDHGHNIEAGAAPVPSATDTTVDAGTIIDASATSSGKGGNVVVWSDGGTAFSGAIAARGGRAWGDGGFVETSGHQDLRFDGTVNSSAPAGRSGTLLLDPLNVTIASAGTHTFTPAAIEAALASNNVVVSTGSSGGDAGDITVEDEVSWNTANSLTLNAARDVVLDATISNSDRAPVVLHADNAGTGVGTVVFNNGARVAGTVSIYYNPSVNQAGSGVNASSYVSPVEAYADDYGAEAGSLRAFMLVNSAADLQNIQNNLSGSYALGRDIDASETASWNGGAGFVPLGGVWQNWFGGEFDGQGHTISHLHINETNPTQTGIGLFGVLAGTSSVCCGYVHDLTLSDASVTIGNYGAYAGILVGWANGQSKIENVHVSGTLQSTGGYIGGLVGFNIGEISDSSADVTITGSGTYIGGLVGNNYENGAHTFIEGSYAAGSIVASANAMGGLAGVDFAGGIDNSFSTVDLTNLANGQTAGLTTYVAESNNASPWHGYVHDSYATGHVGGGQTAGLITDGDTTDVLDSYWDVQATGQSTSMYGAPQTTAELMAGLPIGFDPTIWAIDPSYNGGYPYLLWQRVSSSATATILSPSGAEPPPPSPPPPPPSQPPPEANTLSDPSGVHFVADDPNDRSSGSKSTPNALNYAPPSASARSAAETFADAVVAIIVDHYKLSSTLAKAYSDMLASALVAAIPAAIIDDPQQLSQLQDYMIRELQNEFGQKLKLSDAGDVLVGEGVSIFADLLSAGAGYVLEQRYGLNENSWEVIETQYAVQVAVHASYGAAKAGAVGALAETANTAVSQVVDSIIKTRDVLASADDAFASARAAAQRAIDAANALEQIDRTNPEIAKLRGVAVQVNADITKQEAQAKKNSWNRLLWWTL